MHNEDYKLHLSIHKIIKEFNPYNTSNLIFSDFLNNNKFVYDIKKMLCVFVNFENNSNIPLFSPIIPISYVSILQNLKILWVELINKFVFIDKMYNLFYCEYCDIFDKIVFCDFQKIESVIYRDFKSGESIFHNAGKFRLFNTSLKFSDLSLNNKIIVLEDELNYIINCYEEFGKVFRNGNEYTINYMEDLNGIYLKDYLTKFVDNLVNESLF